MEQVPHGMREVTFLMQMRYGRTPDGLIRVIHGHVPKFADIWWLVNREANTLEELQPYRVRWEG